MSTSSGGPGPPILQPDKLCGNGGNDNAINIDTNKCQNVNNMDVELPPNITSLAQINSNEPVRGQKRYADTVPTNSSKVHVYETGTNPVSCLTSRNIFKKKL